jgi:hypothetical protein
MFRSLVSAALLAATVSTAGADPAGDFAQTIYDYRKETEAFEDYRSQSLDEDRFPIGGCHAAVAKAREAGLEVTDAQVAVCDAFVGWHRLAEAEAVLTPAQQYLYYFTVASKANGDAANQPAMVAVARQCETELSRLLAAGMPTDVEVRIGDSRPISITMADAKAQICDALAKQAGTFAADVTHAKAARSEAIAAPYRNAGITGDRLKLLVDDIDYAMYGAGGGELRTPRQLAAASVIFELLGPNTATGRYTLRRYQFRGHTLVKTTSAEYRKRPGPQLYR